jgi:hypothetical protein
MAMTPERATWYNTPRDFTATPMQVDEIPDWLKRRNEIEASLPQPGKLVIYEVEGAPCEYPIFSYKEGAFEFDTYGTCPPNVKKWENKFNYGMRGSRGKTADVQLVVEAITMLNEDHRVGLCNPLVIEKLTEAGLIVEKVNGGFR